VPPELSLSTIYFLVNVTINTDLDSGTWQLAETPGGTPLTVSSQTQRIEHDIFMAAYAAFNFVGENGSFVPQDDNFMTIMNAAVEYHYGAFGSEVSAADIEQIRAFFAPKTYSTFASWNFNGDLLR
jgi:hypothetical protein